VAKWPNPILKHKGKEVTSFDEELMLQCDRMTEMMVTLDGVGIAANQAGYDNRVCVCWFGAREKMDITVMVNPKIINLSGGMVKLKEACLSCAQCVGVINRWDVVKVEYQDTDGFVQTETFDGWDARIVQHELDHLEGGVIIDKFNQMDKLANREIMDNLQLMVGILPKRLRKKGARIVRKKK